MPNHPNATMAGLAGAVSVVVLFIAGKVGLEFKDADEAAMIGAAVATIVSSVALFIQGPKPSA